MQAPKTHGDNAKVEAKLRKLLALAQRGEGGEKDNAQRMLEKLLARHGMSIDDLVDDRREIRWFPISTKYDRKLAAQIMSKVCNSDSPGLYISKGRVKKLAWKSRRQKLLNLSFTTTRCAKHSPLTSTMPSRRSYKPTICSHRLRPSTSFRL